MRRAGNNRKAPVNKIQTDLTKDEAVSNKLDALMASMEALTGKMTVLAGWVDAAEEWRMDAENPLSAIFLPLPPEGGPAPQGHQIWTKTWQRRYARG